MKVRFLFASLSYLNSLHERLARHKCYQSSLTCTLFAMKSTKLYISQGSTSVPHREKPKLKKGEKKLCFPFIITVFHQLQYVHVVIYNFINLFWKKKKLIAEILCTKVRKFEKSWERLILEITNRKQPNLQVLYLSSSKWLFCKRHIWHMSQHWKSFTNARKSPNPNWDSRYKRARHHHSFSSFNFI